MSEQALDPHVIIAIMCLVGALCIAGAVLVWLAVEREMRGGKK